MPPKPRPNPIVVRRHAAAQALAALPDETIEVDAETFFRGTDYGKSASVTHVTPLLTIVLTPSIASALEAKMRQTGGSAGEIAQLALERYLFGATKPRKVVSISLPAPVTPRAYGVGDRVALTRALEVERFRYSDEGPWVTLRPQYPVGSRGTVLETSLRNGRPIVRVRLDGEAGNGLWLKVAEVVPADE